MSPRPRRRRSRSERRRAIYLAPNLITTASLLLGFWAITRAIHGEWKLGAWGIVLAGIFDMLDGRIARATRSTSAFGIQYDSLADLISFGVAPAVLYYTWALEPMGRRGWALAALFAVCTALRLARFNVQTSEQKSNAYQGLPSTFAGGLAAVIVWFVADLGYTPPFGPGLGFVIASGFVLLALLMVSSVPYLSLSSLPLHGRHSFTTLVGIVLGIVALILFQDPAFFVIGVTYILSGPVVWLYRLRHQTVASQPNPIFGDSPDGR